MGDLIQLERWEVHKFPWGVAIKSSRRTWELAIFSDGQELDLTRFGVILHENGIEFIGGLLWATT